MVPGHLSAPSVDKYVVLLLHYKLQQADQALKYLFNVLNCLLQAFKQIGHLNGHVKYVHAADECDECDVCGKVKRTRHSRVGYN